MDRPFVSTLHLSRAELAQLLDALDSNASLAAPERSPYRMPEIPLLLDELQGGRTSRVLAHGYRLWADGIELLHRAYLLPGTPGTIGLKRNAADEPLEFAVGHVLSSEPVRGTIHLIAFRFTEPIDLGTLLPGA